MNLKRIILVIVLSLLAFAGLLGGTPKPALACVGGEVLGLIRDFRESDIVIKSRVIEVDDLGQNAIVRVEQYYKGNGPEHILITLTDPQTIGDLLNGMPYTSCTWWSEPLYEGDTVFFLVHRTFDGSYYSYSSPPFVYHTGNETNRVIEEYPDNISKYTLSQLAARLTRLGGKAVTPKPDNFSIMYAPLQLVTKNGTRYLLPVDGGKPASIQAYFDDLGKDPYNDSRLSFNHARYDGIGKDRCVGVGCIVYSPNSLSQYHFDACKFSKHDAALFSPVGTYAKWIAGQLFVGCQDTLIADVNTDKDKSAEKLAIYAQWSPDGRKLAYNDLKGLWVWETGKQQNNPRLILPAGKTPVYTRYFSPLGNFLAVVENDKKYTLNLETGVAFYDGIFSPTEEYFLAFGTPAKANGVFPILLCENRAFHSKGPACQVSDFGKPEMDKETNPDRFESPCCEVERILNVHQVEWVGDYVFNTLMVPIIDNDRVDIPPTPTPSPTPIPPWDETRQGYVLRDFIAKSFVDFENGIKYPHYAGDPDLVTGFQFTYDYPNRSLALLKNGSTVMINDRELKFTIGKDIDSPIEQIHWLPSLMYRNKTR